VREKVDGSLPAETRQNSSSVKLSIASVQVDSRSGGGKPGGKIFFVRILTSTPRRGPVSVTPNCGAGSRAPNRRWCGHAGWHDPRCRDPGQMPRRRHTAARSRLDLLLPASGRAACRALSPRRVGDCVGLLVWAAARLRSASSVRLARDHSLVQLSMVRKRSTVRRPLCAGRS
jgi:hypothetical protein